MEEYINEPEKEKIAKLLQEAQPKVEKCLTLDKLTISITNNADPDFVTIEIEGYSLHLKGKAYKVPMDDKSMLLNIMNLKKVKEPFSE